VTRALVHGAGRMARRILALMPEFPGYDLIGVVSRVPPESENVSDWFASLKDIEKPADLLIDFTLPGGTRVAARWCKSNGTALLSGTTGLSDDDTKALRDAALYVPVLWAPNLSQGVALMMALVRKTADVMGLQAEVAITDIHHIHKIDAPSGTAVALSDAVKEGCSKQKAAADRNEELSAVSVRDPVISSVREGEVIGEHTVSFVLPEEVIDITHRATSRDVFARGALNAGEWLVRQEPGFYSVNDWLGLKGL
jgi:4-hydroxy-tetrahydrodipicolinate reductase